MEEIDFFKGNRYVFIEKEQMSGVEISVEGIVLGDYYNVGYFVYIIICFV